MKYPNQETSNGDKVVPDTAERVILTKFLRISDRVMMAVPSTDEGWRKHSVRNGVKGTVVGFNRYRHYQGRLGVYKNAPGHYESNGQAIVQWDNGVCDSPSVHDIVFVDPCQKETRYGDTVYNKAFDHPARIGDLPELPFWELDNVRLVHDHRTSWSIWEDDPVLVVSAINYEYIGDLCDDGVTAIPIYQVEPRSLNRGRITVRPEDIELVARGNMWWWTHDKSKLGFADIREEVGFHRAIGLAKEVECPQTGNYHWPKEHVLGAATAGLIDVLSSSGGLFGTGPSMHGFKLKDPSLSARANKLLCEGFSNQGV